MKKRKPRKNLTLNQFILSSLAVVMAAIVIMTLFLTDTLFRNSIEHAWETNADNAKQVADALEEDFAHVFRLLRLTQNSFTNLDFGSPNADEAAESIMTALLDLTPLIHRAWFAFEEGVYYKDRPYIMEYHSNDGAIINDSTISHNVYPDNPNGAPWYTKPIETAEIYVDISSAENTDDSAGAAYSAVISVPIMSGGKIIGVCCVDMLYSDLLAQLYELHLKQSRMLFLLDQDMTILHSHNTAYIGLNITEMGFKKIEFMSAAIKKNETYSTELVSPFLHERVFLCLQPISFYIGSQAQHLYLQIGTPLRTLYADAFKIIIEVITANCLCMLFIFFMIYFVSNRVVRPIRELARKAQRVALGDFSDDIFESPENEPRGKSETAVLRRAFNEMLRALRENLLTVEKRVEDRTKELKKLNNYITLLIDSTTGYSILMDRDSKILHFSNSLLKLTGATDRKLFINRPFLDVVMYFFKEEKIVNSASRRLAQAISGKYVVEDDTIVWPDGTKIIYRITYSRITDEDNNLEGIILASQDITALRFEEAERRLEDLLYTTNLPCVVWDESGNVIAFNDEAANTFGAPPGVSLEGFKNFYALTQPVRQPDGTLTEDLR
ncbi:MAG: PAS domain-containing protein, partial [Oscillospiraceae bacterium]|nr:PAS domain-containing protein [Oscillospiraceae bacterium]